MAKLFFVFTGLIYQLLGIDTHVDSAIPEATQVFVCLIYILVLMYRNVLYLFSLKIMESQSPALIPTCRRGRVRKL